MQKKYLAGAACLLAAFALPVAATAASASQAVKTAPGLSGLSGIGMVPVDDTTGTPLGQIHLQAQVIYVTNGPAQVVSGSEHCTPQGQAEPPSWCSWNYTSPSPGSSIDNLVIGWDAEICIPGGEGFGFGLSPGCSSYGLRMEFNPEGVLIGYVPFH
jgi:hypothetical protein